MPRNSSFPLLYEDRKTLTISDLKKWGYLDNNRKGTVEWLRDGEVYSSISISSFKDSIYLNYTCNDQSIKYYINIVSKPSNLGKGTIKYFECAVTHKLCRKLYLINYMFSHRNAVNGVYYDSQIRSKNMRIIDKLYGDYFKRDHVYEELHKKHSKKTYKGKYTKRYQKLLNSLEKSDRVNFSDLEKLYTKGNS